MSDQQSSSSDEQHVFDLEDAQSADSVHGFERYQIERSLGSGAMATVLLATDKVLDRKVAIKVPLIKSDKNTEVIEKRFLREAQKTLLDDLRISARFTMWGWPTGPTFRSCATTVVSRSPRIRSR